MSVSLETKVFFGFVVIGALLWLAYGSQYIALWQQMASDFNISLPF